MNIHALCTENKCLFFVCNSGLRAVKNTLWVDLVLEKSLHFAILGR